MAADFPLISLNGSLTVIKAFTIKFRLVTKSDLFLRTLDALRGETEMISGQILKTS